jgi:hypothetical protein
MSLELDNLNELFATTCDETYAKYVSAYNETVEKAGNQERAHNKFLNDAKDNVAKEFPELVNLRHQVEEAWTFDKSVSLESWVRNYIAENACEKEDAIRIGKLFGFELFWNDIHNLFFLGSKPDQMEELQPEEVQFQVQGEFVWRTTPKVEIIDFLKLAYALHHAGILKSKSGHVTDTVNILAGRLDYKLPTRWHSNLTEGFEGVNADYNHFQFLDEIKKGLQIYIHSRSEKKESQKKKS